MSRRRELDEEEEALWRGIARSIKPLRPAKAAAKLSPAMSQKERAPPPVVAPPAAPPPAKSPPLAPFDRRLKQRVARGRAAIDVRIDLHGMTQSEAHAALLRFLRRAQADDAKIALIITGKGTSGPGQASERGVLRRQVPLWLALPEFRPFIVGFEDAHVGHGGQGALYVRLRRAR
jgi:DNA-nicking Smr family endonuclease